MAAAQITLTAGFDLVQAIARKAASKLGVKLAATVVDFPRQDEADSRFSLVVLEDTTGAARATYTVRWPHRDADALVAKVERVTTITVAQAKHEADLWA